MEPIIQLLGDHLLYRENLGWRNRAVFALLRLRPPIAQHTRAEGELLRQFAQGARCAVELGVAEGGSAYEIRRVIHPNGMLYLIDPYDLAHFLNLSAAELVARRLVGSVKCGGVAWLRRKSHEAVIDWTSEIDFLFIDADHRYDAVRRDWDEWTPFVRRGGAVALHDAVPAKAEWLDQHAGPAKLLDKVRSESGWRVVAIADSMAVLQRT